MYSVLVEGGEAIVVGRAMGKGSMVFSKFKLLREDQREQLM